MSRKTLSYLLFGLLVVAALLTAGCSGDGPSEADKDAAKATVEKMLKSGTYEEFLSCFSAVNQKEMKGSSVWRDNWENLTRNGLPLWKVSNVGGSKDKIEVKTKNLYAPNTYRSYQLIQEDGEWVIDKIKLD